MNNARETPLSILVIDDEWLVRDVIVDFLREAGCEVLAVGTGEKAIAILRQDRPIDVVFTDIVLPGATDGWDVAEIARQIRPAIPIIYTSGYTASPSRRVSGSVFFAKPYDLDNVLLYCNWLGKKT